MRIASIILGITLLAAACAPDTGPISTDPTTATKQGGTMRLSSPAFAHNTLIPSRYTCDGFDVNPPLRISDVPSGTMSLVLFVDDPDAPDPKAPKMVWDHWVVWNIDPTTTEIGEGSVPAGAVQGKNSWGRNDYGGPCPPIGTHRYFFKLFALDTTLALTPSASKADVEAAFDGHVIDQTELIGTYRR
ncbi:MAG: YbhB/YbcL family Raf kinase inhibitor-like protein [Actinobacteria bacterium]|nr:YbhB/YbcL family Raf kinase inhibitor-like protein [Actinomycetota bacterium]